jgi:ABC-type dipeptide/oligopeptide/nickel transport system permease component
MDRFGFLLKRPLQLIPVLFGISLITFILVHIAPGDPVRLMLGPRASEQAIAFVRTRYGLDQPILVQYLYYLFNAMRGDFGQTIAFRAPVASVILERIAPTLFLLLYGLTISALMTLGLATAAAHHRGRWLDHVIRFVCVGSVGIPSYFMGLILIMLFCLKFKFFPVSGYGPPCGTISGIYSCQL